jgi:dUTP pyrophosphatase
MYSPKTLTRKSHKGFSSTKTITMELSVKKLSDDATIPTRGSADAAGYDLYSAHDLTIDGNGKGIAKTNLAMVIPQGHYGRIAPRSGFSWKKHADIGAGVIDSDYRGDVGVVIFNHSQQELNVSKGDRVAQLILEKISTPAVVEYIEADLPSTERGGGGFGSTGR